MTLLDPFGRAVVAEVVDDLVGGCFDEIVVMAGEDVFGPGDLRGWMVRDSTERERSMLRRGGFADLVDAR